MARQVATELSHSISMLPLSHKGTNFITDPIETHSSNVATLLGRPWGMDMVDEGVARPFKPWDVETTDYPANASKRFSPQSQFFSF